MGYRAGDVVMPRGGRASWIVVDHVGDSLTVYWKEDGMLMMGVTSPTAVVPVNRFLVMQRVIEALGER